MKIKDDETQPRTMNIVSLHLWGVVAMAASIQDYPSLFFFFITLKPRVE